MASAFSSRFFARLRGVYPGWWVVLASGVIGAYGGGVYFYGFTLFFNPLKEELNLTSAQTSLVFALTRLEGAFEGVFVGYAIDRFGARRVMMVGVPLAATGFLVWALLVDSYITFLLVYVGAVGFGINMGFFHPALAVANNWFIRKRATAMAIVGVSLGVGGAVLVPLLGYSIETLGWRTTAALAGIAGFVIIWPVTLAVHHSPEQRGLSPDGFPVSGSQPGNDGPPQDETVLNVCEVLEINFGVREAFCTRAMYLLLAAMTFRFFAHGAIMVHLAPLLIDHGMSLVAAGGAVGVLSLFSIASRLASGWFGDRYTKRKVVSLMVCSNILALGVLFFATTTWMLYLFIILWSIGYGAGTLNWALIGDYFGRRHFATVRGMMGLFFSLGGIGGPLFAGWVYDTTGTYSLAVAVFAIANVLSAILYWIAHPPTKTEGAASS